MSKIQISSGPRLITIGGTGRSGTTITARIFAGHPDVTDFPKSRFLIDPDGMVDFFTGVQAFWTPYAVDRKLRRLERLLKLCSTPKPWSRRWAAAVRTLGLEHRFGRVFIPPYVNMQVERHCPEFPRYCAELMNELRDFAYDGQWVGMSQFEMRKVQFGAPATTEQLANKLSRFYRQVAADICSRQGKGFFLEKNTLTITAFDRILEIFPDFKLVHIYRDPRDVIASYCDAKAQPWAPNDFVQAAHWYRGVMSKWWAARARVPKDSFIETSFERVIQDREQALREMCSFWDLAWDESLMSVALGNANIGRWRNSFSSKQAAEITDIVGEFVTAYGYK